MTKVICIAGMHRSGTSLVTEWLERCGLQASEGGCVPPGKGNQRGHFEDREFYQLHLQTIAHQIRRSKGWILQDARQIHGLQLDRQKQDQIVNKRNAKYDLWGWKDPRSVFFLEQWKAAIPSLQVLFVWRSCHEVVDSLNRRAQKNDAVAVQITFRQAVRLWKLSNELAIDYYDRHSHESLMFSLPEVLKHDKRVIQLINERFQTNLTYHPITEIYQSNLLERENHFKLSSLCKLDWKVKQVTHQLVRRSFRFGYSYHV